MHAYIHTYSYIYIYLLIFYKCVHIYIHIYIYIYIYIYKNNFFEWSPPWHYIFHIFWHFFWHFIWHVYSDILSGILSGILSDISLLTFYLHCMWHLALAIEVPQCPLRSGSRSWGPAVPTELWHSRLRWGSAHWHLALAVGVRQCPLRSGACSWRRRGEGVEAEAGRGRRRWAALLKKFRDLAGGELLVVYPIKSRLTGWWFRTFFPYIEIIIPTD